MRKIFLLCVAVLFCVMPVFAANSSTPVAGPMDTLKPALTSLTNILLDKNLHGDKYRKERRQKIMAEVKKSFDFREMSKRVLGRTWRTISEEQRDEFTGLMTKLLENVYIGKFEAYEEQAGKYGVKYIGELVKGGRAQVTTEVEGGDRVLPVHYIMRLKNGVWRVYDINVEGMSLIRNYQEQFTSILRTEKFAGLVTTMKKKIAELESR